MVLKIAAVVLLGTPIAAMAAVKIEKLPYRGWPNCYRIANGVVELVVTGDVGPRIIRYGFVGGQNLLKEIPEQLGRSGEAVWQGRGGHRLWIGPEDPVKSYVPDNGPVRITAGPEVLEAVQPVEPGTGLEKSVMVRLSPEGTDVEVTHRIRNLGKKPVELAPWALTMLAPGGAAIYRFPTRGVYPQALAPSAPLVIWSYTSLADGRWLFLKNYLVLRQDAKGEAPQKVGSFKPDTWGAYLLNGELFIKRSHAAGPAASYPDFGCSFEMFTNADFLELETLGPLRKLEPGQVAEHVEHWTIHRGVRVDQWDDSELDSIVLPLVQ